MQSRPKPLVLCILDGWGYRAEKTHNAIAAAKTPNWDRFLQIGQTTMIRTSGLAVGLPEGQMGNSEVGHMNIGAGRVVYQELTRINKAIEEQELEKNPVVQAAFATLIQKKAALHILGLLSAGGVHSQQDHIFAMIRLAVKAGIQKIYLHAFLDGRDTPPRSAADSIKAAEALFQEVGCGQISTLIGRYYAMDRDKRWERVEKAYRLITEGEAAFVVDGAEAGLELAYARGENDEFVQATRVGKPTPVHHDDVIMFMNFRADRAREITYPFIQDDFNGFVRQVRPTLSHFVTLTQYQKDLPVEVIFPPEDIHDSFGEVVAQAGLKQLRIAETEKYPHVTFFFNGGREAVFPNESRILVASPKVATYDLQPEMSANEVTEKLIEALQTQDIDVVICNFANPDMVGHTGVFDAIVKAIETVDTCIGQLYSVVQSLGGEMLLTADHGNAEQTWDEVTSQPHTAHTSTPVQLIYLGRERQLREGGALCDLSPTMLEILGVPQPKAMTGRSLLV